MLVKKAIEHFLEFHKGTVNIVLHIVGFIGIFYSVYRLDYVLFIISFIVVEAGHVYNHITGVTKYDFRFWVIFWRLLIFVIVVAAFYTISK